MCSKYYRLSFLAIGLASALWVAQPVFARNGGGHSGGGHGGFHGGGGGGHGGFRSAGGGHIGFRGGGGNVGGRVHTSSGGMRFSAPHGTVGGMTSSGMHLGGHHPISVTPNSAAPRVHRQPAGQVEHVRHGTAADIIGGHDGRRNRFVVVWPFFYPYPSFYGGYDYLRPYYYSYYGGPSYYYYGDDDYAFDNYAENGYDDAYLTSTENVSDLAAARAAFLDGDYREAVRLANHAIIDAPQDAKAHELLSLALFAVGDYRGAAIEAHYALHFGAAADWPTLYHYYQNVDRYNQHLHALSAYVKDHGDAADAIFLLAYHNLMMGHKDAAKSGFAAALGLTPDDELAKMQLEKLGSTVSGIPRAPQPPASDEGPASKTDAAPRP